MTDASLAGQKAPLGVGGIISDSFSILFGNFGKVFVLGFIGALPVVIIGVLVFGVGYFGGEANFTGSSGTAQAIGLVAFFVILIVAYGLLTALLIQLAYDAKLGRKGSVGTYVRSALPALVPITVLSIVIGILATMGAIALLIGALWVYGVFYVMAPVAVIERGGFRSMSRSADLTKEYRWPIVGLFVVMGIITAVFQEAGEFVAGIVGGVGANVGGQIVAGLLVTVVTGLGYALAGINVALTYARLREIKEGVDVDQIAAVFE